MRLLFYLLLCMILVGCGRQATPSDSDDPPSSMQSEQTSSERTVAEKVEESVAEAQVADLSLIHI